MSKARKAVKEAVGEQFSIELVMSGGDTSDLGVDLLINVNKLPMNSTPEKVMENLRREIAAFLAQKPYVADVTFWKV